MQQQFNLNNKCLICDSSDDLITFSCMDQYCTQCMQEWINTQLNSAIDLKCPQCRQNIEVWDLKFCLDEKLFDRLCQSMLKNNQIQDVNSDEKIIGCFGKGCDSKLFIWKNADYYECKFGCKQKFCLNCQGLFHDKLSCQQASLLKSPEEIEEYLKLKTSGYGVCPYCHTTIQKEEGCNFMTCGSSFCNKKNSFCFNCDMKLSIDDHYNHYENQNPYQGRCMVKSEADQWITNINESKQNNLGQQEGPNQFPCPGCGTYDSKNCSLIENFRNKVCFCQSQQCKQSYFCMKCGCKVTEERFEKHFDDEYNCRNQYNCQIQ